MQPLVWTRRRESYSVTYSFKGEELGTRRPLRNSRRALEIYRLFEQQGVRNLRLARRISYHGQLSGEEVESTGWHEITPEQLIAFRKGKGKEIEGYPKEKVHVAATKDLRLVGEQSRALGKVV